MMNKKRQALLLFSALLSFLLSSSSAFCQNNVNKSVNRWSINPTVGGTLFHGDADDKIIGWNAGLGLRYSMSPRFALSAQGIIGKLAGGRADLERLFEDDPSLSPNGYSYEFDNIFKEASLCGHYTYGNWNIGNVSSQHYLLAGLGMIWSDVSASFTDSSNIPSTAMGEPHGFHDYKGHNVVIPVGIGAKFNISHRLDLGLEYRYHYSRSDHLDGFSYEVWRNRAFDAYSSFNITAGIKLGKNKGHADWKDANQDVYEAIASVKEQKELLEALRTDSDGDGVSDHFDKEPNTEAGAEVNTHGVASDMDQDGVPDNKDDEPFSEKGAEVDSRGRMIDRDEDGVPDYRDNDRNTPAGSLVDSKGNEVRIGSSSSSSSRNTCCDCENIVLPSILFQSNSSRILYSSHALLYQIAEKMKACPDFKAEVIAYAYRSKSGSNLGDRRLQAIVDFMNANYNIPRDRFNTQIWDGDASGVENSSIRVDFQ